MFIQSFRFLFLGVFLSSGLALVAGCENNSDEEIQPTPDSPPTDAGTSQAPAPTDAGHSPAVTPTDAGGSPTDTPSDAGAPPIVTADAGSSPTVTPTDAGTQSSVTADAGHGAEGICALPIESGVCLAYMPSYGFNAATGECESFIYGGCQGNANRFDTLAECEAACPDGQPTGSSDAGTNEAPSETISDAGGPDYCSLPPEPGMCLAAMPRYYYNPALDTCEIFTYGGCGGNDNNFLTFGECAEACMGL